MKRKYPYIVHLNPHIRPRDPVDLKGPLVDHIESGTALMLAVFDAMTVFWTRMWMPKQ